MAFIYAGLFLAIVVAIGFYDYNKKQSKEEK